MIMHCMKNECLKKGEELMVLKESLEHGRLQWLDVLKCLTMLLVVIGHAVPKSAPDTLGYYICFFHMPLFL